MHLSRLRPALLLIACLVLTSSAYGKKPRAKLDPKSFSMQNETLTNEQKKNIYLQLIENSIGWVDQSDKFIENDKFEPGGGYYDAAGSGVSWGRGNSNICLAYALLLSEFPDRQTFSIYKVPRERLEKRLRLTIRSLCLANKNCSRHKEGLKPQWGGPAWQPALDTIGWAWAAHLVEKSLDDDTLELVREVVGKEADNLDKKIPSGKKGNTRAEDCAWNSPLLAWAANKYADDPRAVRWDELAKKWAINTASIAADAKSDKLVDGRPLKEWIVSENAYPDLTIENHGFWSVGYQCAQQHFGEAVLAYRLFKKPVPEAFDHHADQMWKDVTSALYLWDGDIFYVHGQDWSWKIYSSVNYLCWQNCCRGNRAAGAYESRALQMIYRRQLSIGTGDLGSKFSPHLNFGNQTTKMKRWSFCYLMQKHLGEPTSLPFEEAEEESIGYHFFPHLKTAIHRTPQKCVSVTWHPRFQPTFILPEGNRTFTDPPLFVPYDRQAGCAKVQLVDTKNKVISKKHKSKPPKLVKAKSTDEGKSMEVWYKKPRLGGIVTQWIAVYSLPNKATVYFTVFEANQDARIKIGPLFRQTAGFPPGFEKPIQQYRGKNWLNMSDHLGFVSSETLPEKLTRDQFLATEAKIYSVKRGEWFSPVAIVTFTGQPHETTEARSKSVQLTSGKEPGNFVVTLESSIGTTPWSIDFITSANKKLDISKSR